VIGCRPTAIVRSQRALQLLPSQREPFGRLRNCRARIISTPWTRGRVATETSRTAISPEPVTSGGLHPGRSPHAERCPWDSTDTMSRFTTYRPEAAGAPSAAVDTDRPTLLAARRTACAASLWPAVLLLWAVGADYVSHSRYCLQLVFALTGNLRVRRRHDGWRRCAAVFLAPGTTHEIDACGGPLAVGFMDPDAQPAITLDLRDGLAAVPDATVERWRRELGDLGTLDARRVEAWVQSELLNGGHRRTIHPRVEWVVRHVHEQALDRRGTSLACLAQIAQLSPSRLMHVFTESLGIPLRPYLLWLRVQRAAAAIEQGHTATEAAYIAGFADAPHLTRTVRRILGITPRDLIARSSSSGFAQQTSKRASTISVGYPGSEFQRNMRVSHRSTLA
jgi:AraC-like DNA-binding protein